MDKIRPETMDERLQRLVYEYDSPAGMKKPVHMNNKNIIIYENYKQPPKKYDAMDRSTYPSDPDQYQRLIQTNPKSYLNKTEAVLAEMKPSDLKGRSKEDRKAVRMAKAKKFRLMNEGKLPVQKQDKKLFENILDNLKKPISPVRSQYANGGKVASASDDPLYKEYIKEIELGNLSPDIPFDKWRDQYDEILLEGPLSKKYDEIETMILNNALAKIDEAMSSGLSSIAARKKLEGGGKVVDFLSYAKRNKPKIKQLNLADYFKVGMTVANLSESERELVNDLLRRSFPKKK